MRRFALALAVLSSSACAGSAATRSVSETVDESTVQYFPQEGRRWTYEAENEVIIALDRLDSARDEVLDIDRQIREAQSALDSAGERGGKGSEVWAAEIQWLEVRREAAYGEVTAHELGVFCARTQLELTKAQLAVRFDLPVEEDFVTAFEEQYEDCARDLASAKQNAEALARESVEAKEKWRNVRAAYAKRTGDFDHGLWID